MRVPPRTQGTLYSLKLVMPVLVLFRNADFAHGGRIFELVREHD